MTPPFASDLTLLATNFLLLFTLSLYLRQEQTGMKRWVSNNSTISNSIYLIHVLHSFLCSILFHTYIPWLQKMLSPRLLPFSPTLSDLTLALAWIVGYSGITFLVPALKIFQRNKLRFLKICGILWWQITSNVQVI